MPTLESFSVNLAEHYTDQDNPSPLDPVQIAKDAGLLYVSDTIPGIQRDLVGDHFIYFASDGKTISDPGDLERIKKLAIPPAYRDVWICPYENGHIQATGRDAKGRKQYRYHSAWRANRDENKYQRMIDFASALPRIREQVEKDLSRSGMPREKVLATIVRLLELTHIRVGNEEYARSNHSYGLTTLGNEHIDVHNSSINFHFRGKSGKDWTINLKDRKLASIVQRSSELPGQHLFEYLDKDGSVHSVSSTDVNAYIHEISGSNFTAKDFRTWAGTVLACTLLIDCEDVDDQHCRKKNIVQAIKSVSEHLGNTPAICRKCYVHPFIIDAYMDGSLMQRRGTCSGLEHRSLRPEELDVVTILKSA